MQGTLPGAGHLQSPTSWNTANSNYTPVSGSAELDGEDSYRKKNTFFKKSYKILSKCDIFALLCVKKMLIEI